MVLAKDETEAVHVQAVAAAAAVVVVAAGSSSHSEATSVHQHLPRFLDGPS